ncbi:hybrid sensor histidine kinase/response regulator transcription factor [Marinoscillum sp. MHG1-6]|uniref:hybrid sensor histidine kinase/response regulator transcription factor n=1 Tax=Marinoscillum sp. MHG1-6 TaxID=2959627 RepID=UPI002158250B|nr:hybrid sensor histidine kinase/response regulator transcription factor [Marinoscillum sp. MHG1-6]
MMTPTPICHKPHDLLIRYAFHRSVLLMLFLLSILFSGIAQTNRFQTIGIDDGLLSNRVFMVREDHLGFVWIATEGGVSRFDGHNLKHYQLEKIEEVRKRSFVSVFMEIDPEGVIWVVFNNGMLYRYDEALDAFVYHVQLMPENRSNIYIEDFKIASKDQFLVATYDGVFFYNPANSEYTSFGVSVRNVSCIYPIDEGGYFIAGRNGLIQVDEQYVEKEDYAKKEADGAWLPENQKIESLFYQDSEDKLWIGTSTAGLYVYDLAHYRLKKVVLSKEIPVDVAIRSIVDLGGGKMMIGLDGAGIFIYDSFASEVTKHLYYNEDEEYSLSSNAVYDIFINQQRVLFISTYRGGLNIYNPAQQHFYAIKHIRGEANSLKNDVVLSIVEPTSGYISFGTDKGLSIWNKNNNDWQHINITGRKNNLLSAVVLSQAVDDQGAIWAASFNQTISKFSRSGDRFQKVEIGNDLFANEARVKKIFYHPHGELLWGNINSAVKSLNAEGQLREFSIHEPVDIEAYSDTKVILAGRNGINMIDLEYNEIKPLDKALEDALKGKLVASLLVDDQRRLWVGTMDHGVFCYDFQDKVLRQFNVSNGLPSNTIYDLIADLDGHIWVATIEGLSEIGEENIDNYFMSDGILSTDFNRNSALRDDDGVLYFGTNKGVIMFDPATIESIKTEKRIVFTDLYLNHERITAGENSILSQPLEYVDNLKLAHDQNSFSIGFTSVDFIHADQGRFSWTLEGFDDSWLEADNVTRATYTNLDPGDYVFRLRLLDEIGQPLASESSISVTIMKPFWRTAWAYMIYLLVIILLVAMLLYLNRMRLESKNAEERLHFLIEMAHEIKTPLTLIRAPLTDLLGNKKIENQERESLEVALKSADKLHKQMMQFLDFRRVRVRSSNLQIQSVDLIGLIESKVFAFKVLADKKHITIDFKHKEESFIIKSDEQILDKIISNLLSNAIKYTRENGAVGLSLSRSEKKWSLTIKDNGIGISKVDQKKIFTLFYRTEDARGSGSSGSGVGLVLASDLAHTLGGAVKLVQSSSKGSEFEISMPIVETVPQQDFAREKETALNESKRIEEEVLGNEKIKILMVEDDEDLQRYQKHKFEQKFQVLTARDGEEALKMIQDNPPDLIISDVMMPKMNGRQLCMNIKSNVETSHIPFILLTGLESKEHIKQGFESGADDYIVKPFEFEILASKIDNLLQTRSALRDRFVTGDEGVQFQDLSNELDQQFLEQITNLVEENISDPELSVTYLCQAMAMSRTAFYHKLKSLVDLSPAEFIRTIRLKRARKLLLNPVNNISEVAYSTGFSDAKYFSTLFKKYYRQSPSAFVAEKRESGQVYS